MLVLGLVHREDGAVHRAPDRLPVADQILMQTESVEHVAVIAYSKVSRMTRSMPPILPQPELGKVTLTLGMTDGVQTESLLPPGPHCAQPSQRFSHSANAPGSESSKRTGRPFRDYDAPTTAGWIDKLPVPL